MIKRAYSNANLNMRKFEYISILHVEHTAVMIECAFNKRKYNKRERLVTYLHTRSSSEIGSRETVSYASLMTAGGSMCSVRGTMESHSILNLLPLLRLDFLAQSNPVLPDYCSGPRPIVWRLLLLVSSVLNILSQRFVTLCSVVNLNPAIASSWHHHLRVGPLPACRATPCVSGHSLLML